MSQLNPAPPEAMEPVTAATAIAEYASVEAGLTVLREKYAGVVFDVTTPNGLDNARKARAEIREPRYECEKIRKRLKAPALEYSRRIDTEAARITAELENLEIPIDHVIKSEEEAAEARREANRKAEAARLASMRQIVEKIRALPIGLFFGSIHEIRRAIEECANRPIAEMPEEIQEEAALANQEVMATLRDMLAAEEAREAEQCRQAAELAIERQALADERARRAAAEEMRKEALRIREAADSAERERWAREQAEERAELDRQRAEQQREAREAEERLAEERWDIEQKREELDRKFAEECARIAADQPREEAPTSAFPASSEGGEQEVALEQGLDYLAQTQESEPAGSSDLLEALKAEYLADIEAGEPAAVEYAQAESEEIGPSVTAVLCWLLRDVREGSNSHDVHLAAWHAREHLLDLLTKYVAPAWARAEHDRRRQEMQEMASEWAESDDTER